MIWLTFAALILAAIPLLTTLRNLRLLQPPKPPGPGEPPPSVSVLIPARNEEANIGAALEAALANSGLEYEVVVLDDHSTDGTAELVRAAAAGRSNVRLEQAPPLPPGWCGKQHACHALAGLARSEILLFVDADVRLAPDALGRIAHFMRQSGAALASGVPRQEAGTWAERLLIPQIHYVLLGYLPMWRMRARPTDPKYAAGCGQLFAAWAEAYRVAGGHAAIKASLHDGIQLPRHFRRQGLPTNLFDATDLASCRMYHGAREVFAGLGKNATEGLGSPRLIAPMTALLLGGQALPWVLLAWSLLKPDPLLAPAALAAAGMAAATPWLLRARFKTPALGALLQPVGVALLVGIQWVALLRKLRGKPSQWRGRDYPAAG